MVPKKPGVRGKGLKRRLEDAELSEKLAYGFRPQEAAIACKISIRTVFRRMQEPEFAAEVERRQREIFESAGNMVLALGRKAVDTLSTLIDDPATPPTVKASCARSLLEIGRGYRESFALQERIARLEQQANESEKQ